MKAMTVPDYPQKIIWHGHRKKVVVVEGFPLPQSDPVFFLAYSLAPAAKSTNRDDPVFQAMSSRFNIDTWRLFRYQCGNLTMFCLTRLNERVSDPTVDTPDAPKQNKPPRPGPDDSDKSSGKNPEGSSKRPKKSQSEPETSSQGSIPLVKSCQVMVSEAPISQHPIDATNSTIIPYGSYGLEVHGSESDIDALCIGPFFASIAEDFFIDLRDLLKSRTAVSEVPCVKDAKVPLMRFKVDLPCAQNVDVLNPFFLRNIDETSWKSLSGVGANKRILQLVPSVELFQSLLRCVKLWAKRRGVYGNLNGFLGGVHMAILAAFVCGYDPNATLSSLVASFFNTFAYWQWPTPVVLLGNAYPATGSPPGLMPIQLPCGARQYCNSDITRSTFYKMMSEFLPRHHLTKSYLKTNSNWKSLFEPYPYATTYAWFAKIHLSAANQEDLRDWVGWVKSRFRCLLIKIEEVFGLCDPNPTEYVETYATKPNIVYYWGLQHITTNVSDIESVETDFLKSLDNGSFQGPAGGFMLSVVAGVSTA